MIEHAFIWNPWGLFGVAALVVCVATAAFVLVTRPERPQNRRLAMQLFLEGVITFASPAGSAFAGTDGVAAVLYRIHLIALFLIVPVLLRFVATIDTPLAKPLATRAGALGTWLIAAVEIVLLIVRPALFIRGLYEPWWGGRMYDVGPLANVAYTLSGMAVTYSLVVAISAYRRTVPGSMQRTRAGWYATAFGFKDVLILLVTTIVPPLYQVTHDGDVKPIFFMYVWVTPVIEVLFVALMAYGMLRSQLFDIDLRIAAGLRRGTVAAVVLFAFFAAAELAEHFVSEEFGYVIGAFAAAALVFAHKPVEHFAARFSRAVLPGAEASPGYVAFRKLEVYVDALEAAYEDGRISPEDRLILSRLQTKLGIEPADAQRLEADVVGLGTRATV